ncbi:hypothetical protein HK100_005487 [Physocladia obscura]|uniref:Uncharacterized protein n=1 Tax=Physocladia obscura TaxID=109957 RepID=A0AAD5ST28_9FUNG|nr:hypothetical protein HK100_005487 [Physocladia obscura]
MTMCSASNDERKLLTFPDNLELIGKKAETIPNYLQNTLILMVGDSFERRLIEYVCNRTNGILTKASLNGAILSGYSSVRIVRKPALGIHTHWTPDLTPFDAKTRATWIPHFLLSIANNTFPELCDFHGHICPLSSNVPHPEKVKKWNSSSPFWFPPPDLIIAQSGLWDLHQRRDKDNNALKFVNEWTELLNSELLHPLKDALGHVVQDEINSKSKLKQRRWFTRTIPHTEKKKKNFPKSFVRRMNDKLRNIINKDYSFLDWAALVGSHNDWLSEDGIHPDKRSYDAYIQFVLSRLQLLNQ